MRCGKNSRKLIARLTGGLLFGASLIVPCGVEGKSRAKRFGQEGRGILAESVTEDSSEKAIETVVDRLYDLVKARKAISVREVSKALSLPEPQTEKLARLLESSKLVQVNYSLSDIIITTVDEAKAAPAAFAASNSDSAEREILTACEDVARAKTLLEFSKRQTEQVSRKLAQAASQQAASIKAKDVSPALRKRLESLESDAAEAKGYANAALVAATVLEEASQKLSQAATRKGARQ